MFQIYHTGAARHYNLERNEIHLEVRRSQNWDYTTRWNWERWGINKKQTIANCLWDRRTAALAAWKLYESAQVCSRVYKRLRSHFMRPARCHLRILTLIQKKKYFEYIWTVQQEMCQNGVTLGNKTAFLLRDGEAFKDHINWLPLLLSILCVRLDPGVFATEQSCFKLQSHGLVMMLLPCLFFRMTKSRMHTSCKNVKTQSFYLEEKNNEFVSICCLPQPNFQWKCCQLRPAHMCNFPSFGGWVGRWGMRWGCPDGPLISTRCWYLRKRTREMK